MEGGSPYKRTLTLLLLVLKAWLIVLVSGVVSDIPLEPGFQVFKKNIDCGSPNNYSDDSCNISFLKDDGYVESGETAAVNTTVKVYSWLKNLRSFPQGRRNCYTLQVPDANGTAYLISASFFYGNYDNLGMPPTFDLYVGVHHWTTVKFRGDRPSFAVFEDVIHVPTTDTLHVCLVKINDMSGTPFISYLQVRSLPVHSIYREWSGRDVNLRLISRLDYAGNGRQIGFTRYGNDVYHRIWKKYLLSEQEKNELSVRSVKESDVSSIPYASDLAMPPNDVFETAVESKTGAIRFVHDDAEPNSKFHGYFYFAEFVNDSRTIGQREYNISLSSGKTSTSFGPYHSGDYLKPYYNYGNIMTGQGGGLNITIQAIPGSKFFPILNALELFQILKVSSLSTHQDDVKGMLEIKQKYGVREIEWQGDPCVPVDYTWKGLLCNSANPPRIISLNLSSFGLRGYLESSLSNLKSLQILDLSNNDLRGPVPEYLAKLPSLKVLNLRGNKLEGPVPVALLDKSRRGTLKLSLEGNPIHCSANSCNKGNKNKKKLFAMIATPLAAALALIFLLATFRIRKRKTQEAEKFKKKWSCKYRSHKFRYSEVVNVTNNFDSLIGEGGFGKVYLGTLQDGTQVAVKTLSSSSKQGHKEFQNEVELLMGVHHRCLVSLVGCCNEGENIAVIYEYMANGNLRHHLCTNSGEDVLTWKKRLHIAIDVARGLEYMHNWCKPPIVHRDLKTSNILLNDKMEAKIGDFGLSRAFTFGSESRMWTDPKGTFGYLDPQYHKTRMLNKKSDIYSFGVVLLELITGRPAVIELEDSSTPAIHIGQWATPMIERDELENIVDPRLAQGTYQANCARRAIETAMACLTSAAVQRPEISWVCNELNQALEIQNVADGENIRADDQDDDGDDDQKMDTSSNNTSVSSISSTGMVPKSETCTPF